VSVPQTIADFIKYIQHVSDNNAVSLLVSIHPVYLRYTSYDLQVYQYCAMLNLSSRSAHGVLDRSK
jgi:hypothetical protein